MNSIQYCSSNITSLLKDKGYPITTKREKITLDSALRWLRVNHDVYVVVIPIPDQEGKQKCKFVPEIYFNGVPFGRAYRGYVASYYEEAIEAGISYVLNTYKI